MLSCLLDLFNGRCDTDDEEHVPHTAQGLYESDYRSTGHRILIDYLFDNLIGFAQLSLHAWSALSISCYTFFLFPYSSFCTIICHLYFLVH